MPAYLKLIVLLPLDGAIRVLVYRYVAWCYAINARRPSTVCRVTPGWTVLVGWQSAVHREASHSGRGMRGRVGSTARHVQAHGHEPTSG
jgi:hypothetical protein